MKKTIRARPRIVLFAILSVTILSLPVNAATKNKGIVIDLGEEIRNRTQTTDLLAEEWKSLEDISETIKEIQLAVIPGRGPRAAGDHVIAHCEISFSNIKGLNMVERTLIDKAFAEIQLSQGLSDVESSLKLGKFLAADILALVEWLPDTEPPIIRIRMVDSRTGMTLSSLLETEQYLADNVSPVQQVLREALAKLETPAEKRCYIGILDVKSEEPGSQLDVAAEALRMLMAVDLSASPNIILLDREHLDVLQNEERLAGLELDLRSSTTLLDAGIRYSEGQQDLIMTVHLKPLSGGEPRSLTYEGPAGQLAELRKTISTGLLNELKAGLPEKTSTDPQREARVYLARVPILLSSGDFSSAVRMAEVAYVLDPDQETRYWAARAWHALGWQLADDFSASKWREPAEKIATGMSIAQERRYKEIPHVKRTTSSSQDVFWGEKSLVSPKRSPRSL